MHGFKVFKRKNKISAQLVSAFRELPVANVSDVMSRMAAGGAGLRPLHSGGVMAGAALTVKTRPGDNLMVHKALDMAERGDVLVVDAGGDLTNSIIGELMLRQAELRGVAGIVINGAVRDAAAIRAGKLPVFAGGVTHRGPYKDGPGEINVPVAIDGMVISPGDLILGDDDGFLCVPIKDAEAIYQAAFKKHEAEVKQMAQIEAGTIDRSWVDASLKKLGCEFEE